MVILHVFIYIVVISLLIAWQTSAVRIYKELVKENARETYEPLKFSKSDLWLQSELLALTPARPVMIIFVLPIIAVSELVYLARNN